SRLVIQCADRRLLVVPIFHYVAIYTDANLHAIRLFGLKDKRKIGAIAVQNVIGGGAVAAIVADDEWSLFIAGNNVHMHIRLQINRRTAIVLDQKRDSICL